MKYQSYFADESQNFDDIFKLIPSDSIINKNITGFGGTTSEILALRNSIILETHKPVIDGKAMKHEGVLAVHSSVNIADIIKYIRDENVKYKKLISTPESLYKILIAFTILKVDVYNNYFLLFDECEKTITDIHYRGKIIKPMDEFFKFKHKAFMSATLLDFSDPRFKENNFKMINIFPKYNNSKKISIINSNNSIYSLVDELKSKSNNGVKKFIFLSSIKAITTTIKMLNIQGKSSIFCSETSAFKIRERNCSNILTVISTNQHFDNYNFLTERFNSGVDIEIEEDIEIYIVSDVNISHGTLVNPDTDVYQIIGRFRKQKAERKATTTVIACTNSEIDFMEKSYVKIFLKVLEQCYKLIRLVISSLSEKETKSILTELSKILQFNTYIDDNGRKNFFMIDNLYYKNLIKSFYRKDTLLNSTYRKSTLKGSSIKRYTILSTRQLIHSVNSANLRLWDNNKSYREILTEIIFDLTSYEEETITYSISNIQDLKNQFRRMYPEIIEAYEICGGEELLANCFKREDVLRVLSKNSHLSAKQNFAFLKELKETFYEGRFDSGENLNGDFENLINKYNLQHIKCTLSSLKNFVDVGERTRRNNARGYRIGATKF